MTNAEWAIENRPDLFGEFDCAECVNHADARCDMPDNFNKRKCAKGHVEWLLMPYESASEGEGGPVSVTDECEPAETESGPVTDADSREKLELDIRGSLGFTTKDVFGWLDRQAAITRRETVTECDRLNKHYELAKKYCDLKDWLVDIACALGIEWDCLNIPSDDEIYGKIKQKINELHMRTRAENAPETPDFAENPQKTAEKGAEIPRKCETCRFYEPERWNDDSTELLSSKCHRKPKAVYGKLPDDWCGEWSA